MLVDRHRVTLIDMAARIVPRGTAADVVDAVLADLWTRRRLEQYEGRSALGTWLGAVVINAALNARRSSGAREARDLAASAFVAPPRPGAQEANEDLIAVLIDAIASLSGEMKVLVLMYYEQELTLDAIGIVLGCSKSTLSRTLRQAREAIAAEADRLARQRHGRTLDELRRGIDVSTLEWDLRAACAATRDTPAPGVSNS